MDLKKKVSYYPLLIEDTSKMPENMEQILEALEECSFKPLDIEKTTANTTKGWVKTNGSYSERFGEYLSFRLRYDKLVVPEKLVKLKVAEAIALFKEENQVDILDADTKGEVTDAVLKKLRPQGNIVPSFFDIIYSTDESTFLILSKVKAEITEAFDLLLATFPEANLREFKYDTEQSSDFILKTILKRVMGTGVFNVEDHDMTCVLAGEVSIKSNNLKISLTSVTEGEVFIFLSNKLDKIWPDSEVSKVKLSSVIGGDEFLFTLNKETLIPEQLSVVDTPRGQDIDEAKIQQIEQVFTLHNEFALAVSQLSKEIENGKA